MLQKNWESNIQKQHAFVVPEILVLYLYNPNLENKYLFCFESIYKKMGE